MMKKEYSKPQIFFDDFSLSTNIAAGCEERPFGHIDHCGVKWGKTDVLFDGLVIENCTVRVSEGDPKYNYLCYHNPFDYNTVFTS